MWTRRRHQDSGAQRKEPVKTRQDDSCRHAKARGLERSQPCPASILDSCLQDSEKQTSAARSSCAWYLRWRPWQANTATIRECSSPLMRNVYVRRITEQLVFKLGSYPPRGLSGVDCSLIQVNQLWTQKIGWVRAGVAPKLTLPSKSSMPSSQYSSGTLEEAEISSAGASPPKFLSPLLYLSCLICISRQHSACVACVLSMSHRHES